MLFGEALIAVNHYWHRLTDITRIPDSWPYTFATKIEAKTHCSPQVISFLDGTWVDVQRTGGDAINQEVLYNAYHKTATS